MTDTFTKYAEIMAVPEILAPTVTSTIFKNGFVALAVL
jgi:hypothetical protein